MLQDAAALMACQIPVGVLRHVDGGGFVSSGLKAGFKHALLRQHIAHCGLHSAREALQSSSVGDFSGQLHLKLASEWYMQDARCTTQSGNGGGLSV